MTYWKGDECISITNDPYHKRKGLYVGNRFVIHRIATFNTNEDAEEFDNMLGEFFKPLLENETD